MNSDVIVPSKLKVGDKVALVSPSGFVDSEIIENARNVLTSWGLNVVVGQNAAKIYKIYAGTDAERASDFQSAIDDDSVKAIICTRGGYGAIRIIDQINFDALQRCPKLIVGFSDITVFHSALIARSIASLHSPMPKTMVYNSQSSIDNLRACLFGSINSHKVAANQLNRVGNVSAPLVGGNLSIIYSLIGTKYELKTDGKILLIEDLCENLYHLDRMMHALQQSGALQNLAGLVVGAFTKMRDSSPSLEMSANDIIAEMVEKYDFPVAYDFNIGHIDDNNPFVHGMTYNLNVDNKFAELIPNCKSNICI